MSDMCVCCCRKKSLQLEKKPAKKAQSVPTLRNCFRVDKSGASFEPAHLDPSANYSWVQFSRHQTVYEVEPQWQRTHGKQLR